jgi:hypothetical protein
MTKFKIFMYIWSMSAIFIGMITAYNATFANPFMLIVGLGATVIGVLGFTGAIIMGDDL